MSEIKRIAKERNAIYLKVDPDIPIENEDWQAFFKDYGFQSPKAALDLKEFNHVLCFVSTLPPTKRR